MPQFKLKSIRTILIALGMTIVIASVVSLFTDAIHAARESSGGSGIADIKKGISNVAGSTGLKIGDETASTDSALAMIGRTVNVLLGFLGAGFLVLVLYAGGIWMFAMGESKRVEKAKNIIKTASIGIAVIILSFFIVNFVLNIVQKVSSGGAGDGTGDSTTDNCGGTCILPKKCVQDVDGRWVCK